MPKSKEGQIIQALNEQSKLSTKEGPVLPRRPFVPESRGTRQMFELFGRIGNHMNTIKNEDGANSMMFREDIDGAEYLYTCPDCGVQFIADEMIDYSMECPECGATIEPEYMGEVEDYDDDEIADVYDYDVEDDADDYVDDVDDYEDEYIDDYDVDDYDDDDDYVDDDVFGEAKFVRGGKVIQKKVKKGYKNVDGKLVKMSAKEIRARQKNVRKAAKRSHTAGADKARAKSMKLHNRVIKDSLNLYFNENSFMELMNGVIEDVMFELPEKYLPFEITECTEVIYDESQPDLVEVTANVQYQDGTTNEALFAIKGIQSDDGRVTIKECRNVFDPAGLHIVGYLAESMDEVNIDKMGYSIRLNGRYISESFIYESEEAAADDNAPTEEEKADKEAESSEEEPKKDATEAKKCGKKKAVKESYRNRRNYSRRSYR